jgi:Leucine-rich repeat (LRR) protein
MKGNLDGTIVTPGDPSDSALYQVIMLPDDDPEIMPPKGEPLSEEQKVMVKRWILEGASEQPAAVAADPNATPKPKAQKELAVGSVEKKVSLLDILAKRASLPSKTQLKAAEKTGALVTQLSERNSLVRAEFSSFASEIDDSALGAFGNIKNNISHLDISRTKVSDVGLRAAGSMTNLTWLSARNTIVSDNGLKSLSSLQHLSYLNLSGTKVSDKGLKTLAALKSLNEIYLWGSEVTENGVESLRESLPNAKILF